MAITSLVRPDEPFIFKVYSKQSSIRIDGLKIWVGTGLTGGNYNGAENIGTIKYESGTNPYVFSDLAVRGSSVQIQGTSNTELVLAEVEVYARDGKRSLILRKYPSRLLIYIPNVFKQ